MWDSLTRGSQRNREANNYQELLVRSPKIDSQLGELNALTDYFTELFTFVSLLGADYCTVRRTGRRHLISI